jgi:hypothetical protein
MPGQRSAFGPGWYEAVLGLGSTNSCSNQRTP